MTGVEAWDELQRMVLASKRGQDLVLPATMVAAMKRDMKQAQKEAEKAEAEYEALIAGIEADAKAARAQRPLLPMSDVLQRVNLSGLFEGE